MSRPIQSGGKNNNAAESSDKFLRSSIDEGAAAKDGSFEVAPRMILDRAERTHVFQDVPDDIRFHFNACFLPGNSPYETAKIYGVLARVSHAHQALRVLYLQKILLCCRFKTGQDSRRGWTRLMQVLPSMPKLALLDLRNNEIDDTAADALLMVLKSSKSIKNIMLGRNSINEMHSIWRDPRVSGLCLPIFDRTSERYLLS